MIYVFPKYFPILVFWMNDFTDFKFPSPGYLRPRRRSLLWFQSLTLPRWTKMKVDWRYCVILPREVFFNFFWWRISCHISKLRPDLSRSPLNSSEPTGSEGCYSLIGIFLCPDWPLFLITVTSVNTAEEDGAACLKTNERQVGDLWTRLRPWGGRAETAGFQLAFSRRKVHRSGCLV